MHAPQSYRPIAQVVALIACMLQSGVAAAQGAPAPEAGIRAVASASVPAGSIVGFGTDVLTGGPPYPFIVLINGEAVAMSDSRGRFEIAAEAADTIALEAIAIGIESVADTLVIPLDRGLLVEITVTEAGPYICHMILPYLEGYVFADIKDATTGAPPPGEVLVRVDRGGHQFAAKARADRVISIKTNEGPYTIEVVADGFVPWRTAVQPVEGQCAQPMLRPIRVRLLPLSGQR